MHEANNYQYSWPPICFFKKNVTLVNAFNIYKKAQM